MRHFWFYCKPSAMLHGERKGVSREHHSLHLSSTELSVWTGRRPMDPTQTAHRFAFKTPSSAAPRSHSFRV